MVNNIVITLCFTLMFGLFFWSCLCKHRKYKQRRSGAVAFIEDLKRFVEGRK